jgi:hypothetical protein
MSLLEPARGSVSPLVLPTLIASLDLKPEMKVGSVVGYSLTVEIDADVCVSRNRPH